MDITLENKNEALDELERAKTSGSDSIGKDRIGKSAQDIRSENTRLHAVLREFIDAADNNRKAHKKFRSFELQLLSCNQFDELLIVLLDGLKEYFELDDCCLWLCESNLQTLTLLRANGFNADRDHFKVVKDYNTIARHYEQLTVKLKKNCSKDYIEQFFPGHSTVKSIALLPLIRNGLLVGSLHLGSRNSERFSPLMATDYLEHLSYIISICIENSINQHQLLMLSMVDVLTRVYNRRAFHEGLKKELSRAARLSQPLSLLFLDIDYFKMVNDTYGHHMGDVALKEIAQISSAQLRTTDMIARYGGEEFTIILPSTSHTGALQIAERIRKVIKTSPIIEGETVLRVTLSIGVSCWESFEQQNIKLENLEDKLLSTADEALYLAKQHGRDQVRYLPLG